MKSWVCQREAIMDSRRGLLHCRKLYCRRSGKGWDRTCNLWCSGHSPVLWRKGSFSEDTCRIPRLCWTCLDTNVTNFLLSVNRVVINSTVTGHFPFVRKFRTSSNYYCRSCGRRERSCLPLHVSALGS